ncbi:MAG: methyltransferase domain-containing protein [Candidatus Krumholzibacteriia bacterium]
MGKPDGSPFARHHRRYDAWFVHNAAAYDSELRAVGALLPRHGRGLALGVGTGRFAAPLGVRVGVDPAREMLIYARQRGISVVQGVAEALPFPARRFDHALCVTTICFVMDIPATLAEAYRILKPGAPLVIGFIDRESVIGRSYLARQARSLFYREASFVSADEVADLLRNAGFIDDVWLQTLFRSLDQTEHIEDPIPGHGEGAFVAVRALRRR